ncbi:hypothetical protein, partial [Streptococcus pneumoniae]
FIMKKKNGKAKKWQLYAAIGAASVVVLGAGGILLFRQWLEILLLLLTLNWVMPVMRVQMLRRN